MKKKKVVNKKKRIKKISPKKTLSKKLTKKKVVKKNIIKKSSPKKILQRAKMGIPTLDKMMNGGYERESINLVAGGSGAGKTIFAMEYLLAGIQKGEKALFITFEEKKEEFYNNMKKFGWDLNKLEKEGKFFFLEYSPEKVKMMLDEGGGTIETIVLKENIKRMVIDSITSFSMLFETDLEKRQTTLGLFDIIRKWDVTTLLTVQDDPTDEKSTGLSSIEFEVDSIVLLYYLNVKGRRQRFIEILKMRGTSHCKEIRSFEIEKGIKIGKKANLKNLIK